MDTVPGVTPRRYPSGPSRPRLPSTASATEPKLETRPFSARASRTADVCDSASVRILRLRAKRNTPSRRLTRFGTGINAGSCEPPAAASEHARKPRRVNICNHADTSRQLRSRTSDQRPLPASDGRTTGDIRNWSSPQRELWLLNDFRIQSHRRLRHQRRLSARFGQRVLRKEAITVVTTIGFWRHIHSDVRKVSCLVGGPGA